MNPLTRLRDYNIASRDSVLPEGVFTEIILNSITPEMRKITSKTSLPRMQVF